MRNSLCAKASEDTVIIGFGTESEEQFIDDTMNGLVGKIDSLSKHEL